MPLCSQAKSLTRPCSASTSCTPGPCSHTPPLRYPSQRSIKSAAPCRYARQNTKPTLNGIDQGKIISFYTELRKESASGGVAVAVRHIESIIRMSEASARMHLRDQVKDEDVNLAISVLLRSVVKSQKFSVAREMKKKFAKYEVGATDPNQLIEFELRNLFRQASELQV